MEIIILAGGLGTRLKGISGDVPKPMIEINQKPFLQRLLDSISKYNISRVVISIHYNADYFIKHLDCEAYPFEIKFVVDDKLYGTGGAIKKSLTHCVTRDAVVLNGDTFTNLNLEDFYAFHLMKNCVVTMSALKMSNFSRYGSLKVDSDSRVTSFEEKKFVEKGFINAGCYVVNRNFILEVGKDIFSFEEDILQSPISVGVCAFKYDGYFIDIGIPDDYYRACNELQ